MSKPHIRIHYSSGDSEKEGCRECMFFISAVTLCTDEGLFDRQVRCIQNDIDSYRPYHYELISGNINDLKKEKE